MTSFILLILVRRSKALILVRRHPAFDGVSIKQVLRVGWLDSNCMWTNGGRSWGLNLNINLPTNNNSHITPTTPTSCKSMQNSGIEKVVKIHMSCAWFCKISISKFVLGLWVSNFFHCDRVSNQKNSKQAVRKLQKQVIQHVSWEFKFKNSQLSEKNALSFYIYIKAKVGCFLD